MKIDTYDKELNHKKTIKIDSYCWFLFGSSKKYGVMLNDTFFELQILNKKVVLVETSTKSRFTLYGKEYYTVKSYAVYQLPKYTHNKSLKKLSCFRNETYTGCQTPGYI